MKKIFILGLLASMLYVLPSFADEAGGEPYLENVKHTLYLYKPINTQQALKLLNVLDQFDLMDININVPGKSIQLKYSPSAVNLATLINTINKMGYKIIRVK